MLLPPGPVREVGPLRFLVVRPGEVLDLCMELADKILESDFSPETMVAIHRGGMIVARYLSDLLDIRDIRAVRVEHYVGTDRGELARVVEPVPTRLDGRRVLVVDDVADTGESLAVAREHVAEMGAEEVKTAVLHYKPWSKIKPDFYVVETDAWVVYCWEYAETARHLFSKLTSEGFSREEALRIIMEEAGVPEKVVRWVGL